MKGFSESTKQLIQKKGVKNQNWLTKKKRTGWQKEIMWTTGTSCSKVGEHYAEDRCNQISLLAHQWTVIYQRGHPYCYIICLAKKQNWDHPLKQLQASCGVSGKLELLEYWAIAN